MSATRFPPALEQQVDIRRLFRGHEIDLGKSFQLSADNDSGAAIGGWPNRGICLSNCSSSRWSRNPSNRPRIFCRRCLSRCIGCGDRARS